MLEKQLGNDIIHYSKIGRSINNIEKRIEELDNVLQEATKNIVNISRPSHEKMISKLTEAKKCKNEAAQIKQREDIMNPATQSRITILLTKSAEIINELINETEMTTATDQHEAQNAMFNISINCMVSNELIRQIVKEMTNAFEYLLQTIGNTMNNLKKAISGEKLEKCLPHEESLDKIVRQMQINMDIVNAMMEKVTSSGDDVRRLQATAEISIESGNKRQNHRVMEFVEIGRILAEKCGISILTASSAASTRFEQATQRLFNTNELNTESTFHRIISQTYTELPCFNNVTYPENTFGNTKIPYNVNDLIVIHKSLMREYNSLRVAYKSLMGICEIQLRRIDDMNIQNLQMQQWFLDYVGKIREINICTDLLLMTEQSKRIRYGDRIDELIVLMDIHHEELDEICRTMHPRSTARLEKIACINATTLQAVGEVISKHLTINECESISENHYESYFNSNASVPEFSQRILAAVGSSPTGSDYMTPTESRPTSSQRKSNSPRSPSNEPRQRSMTPSRHMKRQSKSPNGNGDKKSGGELKKKRHRRSRKSKSPNTKVKLDAEKPNQEQNQEKTTEHQSVRPKTRKKKPAKNQIKKKSRKGQVKQQINPKDDNSSAQPTASNKSNGSNRSKKKQVSVETDLETIQRQRLFTAMSKISEDPRMLTPNDTAGIKRYTKEKTGDNNDDENEEIWFTIETSNNFNNENWRTRARLYRETLIREHGGDPSAFKDEEEYAPIWHPQTGRLVARIYKRRIVAEVNSPNYQNNIDEAMNGMTPNEACAIKGLIEFGKSEKHHQRAMEKAGPADRARLILERRQLADCVQEQLKIISAEGASNIAKAFAPMDENTCEDEKPIDLENTDDSISKCPHGSVIRGDNRMLLPERDETFQKERSNYTSEQMQVIKYYQQQANRLDEELEKTMGPDISDEETETIQTMYKALKEQYLSSMELAKNDLRIFDTILDVSLMEENDPKREIKIAKYTAADREQEETRWKLDRCIKTTTEMMKKIESLNKKRINDKVKKYHKGRCGRKAAMKWINRRIRARDDEDKSREKVEETISKSIIKLPPGFSAQISVRRTSDDGLTDEEDEMAFEESSGEDADDSQRIFTISAISSDKLPESDWIEPVVEYYPTPPFEEYYPTSNPPTPPDFDPTLPPLATAEQSSDDEGRSSDDEPPDLTTFDLKFDFPPEYEDIDMITTPPALTRSAATSPQQTTDIDESFIETLAVVDMTSFEAAVDITPEGASASPSDDDTWKRLIMEIVGMKQAISSTIRRDDEQTLKAIMEEVKRKNQHEKDGECGKCELRSEDMMLEIEQPATKESPSETASKLIKSIKKAKNAINRIHKKKVTSYTQTDDHIEAGEAGSKIPNSPPKLQGCKIHGEGSLSCERQKILGVPDRKLGYSTQLMDELTDELGSIRLQTRGITKKCETYYDAAIRLGVDGLYAYRKKIEKQFIEALKEQCALKPIDDYIDEVYKEAKQRQKLIERIGMDISMRMHNLHDHDMWKRWGTYQHIDRTVARANEKIDEWKETVWPKIRFIDDEKDDEDSTATASNSDDEDEDAKLGAAAPKN